MNRFLTKIFLRFGIIKNDRKAMPTIGLTTKEKKHLKLKISHTCYPDRKYSYNEIATNILKTKKDENN